MTYSSSRRRFLQSTAASGVALLAMHGTKASLQPTSPPRKQLRIRKSALQLPANDPVFDDYADAVKAMHNLPGRDRRNWRRQAQIHADHCVHGGSDFLPWHRHYINQFEAICGELIGKPSFALPYWDWSDGIGKIPDAFFDMQSLDVTHWNDPGRYSPPNWPNINTVGIRAIGKGVGVQNDRIRGGAFTTRNINSILRETGFNRFSARLEGSPHNSGHVVVGFPPTGTPGHIGSGLSPLDPLFWLHHCNVDRLWAQWQLAGNNSPNFGQRYNGQFADKAGQPINVTAADAIDFSALGYSYQQFPDPRRALEMAGTVQEDADSRPLLNSFLPKNRISESKPITIGMAKRDEPVEVGIPTSIPVPVKGLKEQLTSTRPVLDVSLPGLTTIMSHGIDKKMLAEFGKPKTTNRRILASIKGVKGDFHIPPTVNVFLNCPYLSPETPFTDTHFADTFAFFGTHHGGNEDHKGREFIVDLTNAIESVDLEATDSLQFQLMAAGPDPAKPSGSFTFDSVEIFSA